MPLRRFSEQLITDYFSIEYKDMLRSATYRSVNAQDYANGFSYGSSLSNEVFAATPLQDYYVRVPYSSTSTGFRIALACYDAQMGLLGVSEADSEHKYNSEYLGNFNEFGSPVEEYVQNIDDYYMVMGIVTTLEGTAFIQVYTQGKVLETTDMIAMDDEYFRLDKLPHNIILPGSIFSEGTMAGLLSDSNFLSELTNAAMNFLPVSIFSPMYGKTWYAIGDSNTSWYGGTTVDNPEDLGFLTVAARLNGCTFENKGYAGARWELDAALPGLDDVSGIGRVDELIASEDTYDLITIMLGTNVNVEGETTDTVEDTDTMCGAVRYCLEKLLINFPSTPIGIILPLQREEGNEAQLARNNKIKTICEEYSIPTLDLYKEGQVIPDESITIQEAPAEFNLLGDGLHLGSNGKANVGRKLGHWIRTL